MANNLLMNVGEMFVNLFQKMGFMSGSWENYVMILISFVLFYLAIVKKFEPLLLLPIAFGMFLINLPGAYDVLWGTYAEDPVPITAEEFSALNITLSNGWTFLDGQIGKWVVDATNPDLVLWQTMTNVEFESLLASLSGVSLPDTISFVDGTLLKTLAHTYENVQNPGLLWYLFFGVQNVIYPPLIFLGIGAMTDFGPLISNPKSMLIGAAAQFGIFLTLIGATLLGFDLAAACSIAIIGGADGPTAIYVTQSLAKFTNEDLLSAIAVAAYSYMALIPIIQKPLMKLIVPKKERTIKMKPLRVVSKTEKIIFPIVVTLVVGILLPDAVPLLGMLMLGNLLKESGVCDRLSSQAQNGLMNTVTIFLGISVGCKAYGATFLQTQTLMIIGLGLVAFSFGTIGGLLMGRLMCKLSGGKINPLIGSAGVSAVPMAARISEDVGREEDPSNHLLMHAMGPNVAGVIGSAIAAGFLLSLF